MASWQFPEGSIEVDRDREQTVLTVGGRQWITLNGTILMRVTISAEPRAHVAVVRALVPTGFSLIDPDEAIAVIRAWSEGRATWIDVEAALNYD